MQGRKASFLGTLDGGCPSLVFQESQLTEAASVGQPRHLLKPADSYRLPVVRVREFEYLLMDEGFTVRNGTIECL